MQMILVMIAIMFFTLQAVGLKLDKTKQDDLRVMNASVISMLQ